MEITDDISIDTALLATFRELAVKHNELTELVGNLLQCRVVVDANIVISDLRQKILYPERGKTALEELMASSVLVVVAPRWLDAEMPSAIAQYAERSGVQASLLHQYWAEYRKQLIWDERFTKSIDTPLTHVDPKDAPYVFTQWAQNAVGVVSKDPHITQMGGNKLTLDFVFSVRSYARAKVIAVTIKVGGVVLGAATIGVVFELIKVLVQLIKKIPPELLILLFFVALMLFINPESRKWVGERLGRLKAKLAPIVSEIALAAQKGATMTMQKEADAAKHLSQAQSHAGRVELTPKSSVKRRRRVKRTALKEPL